MSNRDWDPSYLALLFSEDFYDMSHMWRECEIISDEEMCNIVDKYSPEIKDISLPDEVLRDEVERIEQE